MSKFNYNHFVLKKISILIACYNSSKTIKKTISSLKKQKYKNFEIIVIDGGSSDNTVNIIKSFKLKNIKIISEQDNGIGDAWNKGLKLCRGDIIGILNSDDYYEENIFNDINCSFSKNNKPLIGYGDVILIDSKTKSKKVFKGKIKSRLGLLNGFGFLHPSVFFNKKALKKIGFFNSKICIAVDADWLIRAKSLNVSFKKIPSVTYMLSGGTSFKNRYTGMGEYMDSLARNGYSDFDFLIFYGLRFLGKIKKIFFSWKLFG